LKQLQIKFKTMQKILLNTISLLYVAKYYLHNNPKKPNSVEIYNQIEN
jgi:hypothetical protein